MSTLTDFLNERLNIDDAKPFDDPNQPPWWEEGVTVVIDEATYMERLEILPPRYMSGLLFAYGEGAGPFTLFWQQGGQYFAHQLSQHDTALFCRLSNTRLHL